MLARPLAALLAIALPIQAVPLNPAIRKAVPEANAAGDGGSGHGSRSRRERALFVRVELVVVALSREKDQAGKVTQFQYDKLGRLTKVIDAESGETTYGYDELGNRIRQTDANNRSTWFLYDKLGREKARILPDGSQEQKTYNAVGNLETRTDFQNRVTTYGYDLNNRLTTRTYPNAAENVSFTYTLTGRRETATDARGTTNYGYDNRDRLTTLTQPGAGQLTYGYDNNGNRSTLTANVGANSYATTYTYDDASRLDLVIDPASRTHDHGYDNNGNRTSLQHPNGTTTIYNYNTLNRLTDLTTTGPTGTVFSQVFTLGAAGNREQIVENDGTTKVYGYDNLYRLTTEAVTVGALTQYTKAFTYDPVGNRQTQVTTGSGAPGTPTAPGTITYGYDTRDRLLTENANNLTYDPSGNLTAKVGNATYTWDHENRLVNVTKTDGTAVAYVYDADGIRVSTTTTPSGGTASTTNYLVDTSGGLSHVVAETDATNTLTALYIRGMDDLLSVMRPAGGGTWTSKFFHADGIGSIRRLTNDAGTITDGYSYTAFGEQIGHTGTDPQPYSFAGEPLDPNSGFQDHRARWMDPRLARFAGMDSFEGRESDPATLHKYFYAGGDPANRFDSSGREFTVIGTLGAGYIASTLAAGQANIGLAVLDQIQHGGDAGLKSIAIGAAVMVAGMVAIKVIGALFRRVPPALPPGRPPQLSVLPGILDPHELAQVNRILNLRGGKFVGPPTRAFPGIDGWLDGLTISLKTGNDLNAILNVTREAADKAAKFGHTGVELFIDSRMVKGADIILDLPRLLVGVLREGTISVVNIETASGWIRILP